MANDQFWFPFGCLRINFLTHFSYLLPFSCLLSFIAELIYFICDIATSQLFCNSCWSSFYLLLFLETFDNLQKVSVVILLFALLSFLQASNLKALFLIHFLWNFFNLYPSTFLLHFPVSFKLIYFDAVPLNLKTSFLLQVLKLFFNFLWSFLITFSFFFHPIFSFLQYKLFRVL